MAEWVDAIIGKRIGETESMHGSNPCPLPTIKESLKVQGGSVKIIRVDGKEIARIDCCGRCVHLGLSLFCYELDQYLDDLDIIHPDCPLPDDEVKNDPT